MKAKDFIENWYGKPIPPDWDLEHQALENVTIIQLEDMLNQFALQVAGQAVEEEKKTWLGDNSGLINRTSENILSRIKQLTEAE